MKLTKISKYIFLLLAVLGAFSSSAQSQRGERRLIMEGNSLYVKRDFKGAAQKYNEALQANGESAVARYNLGLAQIRQVVNPKDTTPRTRELLDNAVKNFQGVASLAKTKPGLAAKANYNLGNLEFNTDKYKEAIEYYKQALRIDPNDNNARKNLRIAQLKQQNQNQNKDQNQDKNQDQNKDKDKDKDQDKDQNKDQDKDQNKDQNKDRNQPKEKEINDQTASQILQAIDNKENQTRARVNRANKGEKTQGGSARTKKW